MRRSDIVFGIILVLSISDFTLGAPVLEQEKRKASVDVVHIPREVITVLGKRGSEEMEMEMEKLMKELSGTWETPVESSGAHVPSSSAPPVSDHGSMNDVKAPAPNPASSPANPDAMVEPLNPSPISYAMPAVQGDALSESESDYEWLFGDDGEPIVPIASPTSSEFGPDHEPTGEHAPQPKPKLWPSAGTDPNFDWEYWANAPSPPRKRPALPKGVGQASESQVEYMHMQQPNLEPSADSDFDLTYWKNLANQPPLKKPKLASLNVLGQAHDDQEVDSQHLNPGPPTDSDFDWKYWINLVNRPPLKKPELSSLKELGQAHDDKEVGSQHLNPGPPTDSVPGQTEMFDLDNLLQRLKDARPEPEPNPRPFHLGTLPTEPGLATKPEPPDDPKLEPLEEPYPEVVPGPPPSPELTDPELHSDHQPVDLLAAIAKVKGKSKESFPDTAGPAGGAGNAA
jgi:hypothetical protein